MSARSLQTPARASHTTPRAPSSLNIRDFAQRLLAHEAAAHNPPDLNMPVTWRVSEKLRRTLSTLVGSSGFRSLATRALTLAKAQAPALGMVQVNPDGSLENLSGLENPDQAAAGVILIAQLLALLVTFIGESLVLSLVQDTWPDLPALDTLGEK